MAHRVVKITVDDDGTKKDSPKWCYVWTAAGSPMALCTMEVFGYGESGCEFKDKRVEKGGITCPDCLQIIKEFKSIKL